MLFESNTKYAHCFLKSAENHNRRDQNFYHASVCDLRDVGHKVSWPLGKITTQGSSMGRI